MADITNLLRQHNEILDLAGKISAYKTEQHIQADAFALSLLLAQLSGKIKIHMTTEDKFVYPSLLSHTNQKVRVVSQKFADEMGNIAQAFESYKVKYMNSREISTNPIAFLNETQTITTAITKRIERENTELYPLL